MLAITNAMLYPITEKPFKGTLLIKKGKIDSMGATVPIPKEADILDAEGKMVFPGFIDAHAHTGIFNEGSGFQLMDDGNEMTDPVTAECRAIDAINFLDPAFKHVRAGGVTAMMTGPGSGNIIGGQSALIKTYGKSIEEMVIDPFIGLKMALGENPISVYSGQNKMPSTRMGNAAILRKILLKTQQYIEKWKRYEAKYQKWIKLSDAEKIDKDEPDAPDKDLALDAIAKVLLREVPARIHCHRADDILTAIRIAKEFHFKLCLEHVTEGWKIADQLAQEQIPVILGPHLVTPFKFEMKDQSIRNAMVLHNAGVKFCIQTDDMRMVQLLALNAGVIAGYGLPEEEALKAITLYPAEILGVAGKMGSLTPGKDADFSIFSGHPFDSRSRAEKVFINGNQVYDIQEDTDMI